MVAIDLEFDWGVRVEIDEYLQSIISLLGVNAYYSECRRVPRSGLNNSQGLVVEGCYLHGGHFRDSGLRGQVYYTLSTEPFGPILLKVR